MAQVDTRSLRDAVGSITRWSSTVRKVLMALSGMMVAAVVYAGGASALGSSALCGEVEVAAVVMA
jgi:hypothetical protein